MSRGKQSAILSALLVGGLLVLAAPCQAGRRTHLPYATRTFAFMAPPNAEPDFTDDESIAVVVAPGSQDDLTVLEFVDDDDANELVDGTVWNFRDAIHITADPEAPEGMFVWLQTTQRSEPPPIGSSTLTGPDNVILNQQVFYVSVTATGEYRLADPETADAVFVVVTAQFTL